MARVSGGPAGVLEPSVSRNCQAATATQQLPGGNCQAAIARQMNGRIGRVLHRRSYMSNQSFRADNVLGLKALLHGKI
jgi:hypothetical protein